MASMKEVMSLALRRACYDIGEIPVAVKKHSFSVSLCPAVLQQKLLSSP